MRGFSPELHVAAPLPTADQQVDHYKDLLRTARTLASLQNSSPIRSPFILHPHSVKVESILICLLLLILSRSHPLFHALELPHNSRIAGCELGRLVEIL